VLNEVEQGTPVVIERRGVQYVLRVEPSRRSRKRKRRSAIEVLDPAVATGQWRWSLTSNGLRWRGSTRRTI
jgi:hypothetical protein